MPLRREGICGSSSTSSRRTGPTTKPKPDRLRTPDSAIRIAPDGTRLVSIGEIVGAHGVRGEARMRLFNPESEVLSGREDRRAEVLGALFLLGRGRDPRPLRVESARPHGAVWLLVLEGVRTPEAARALSGQAVAIPERELPPLRSGEFYHYQLIGLTVVDASGAALGAVSEVLSVPGNDVLVVSADGRERLIPLIDRLVQEIDLEARRMVVQPIDGLLD